MSLSSITASPINVNPPRKDDVSGSPLQRLTISPSPCKLSRFIDFGRAAVCFSMLKTCLFSYHSTRMGWHETKATKSAAG